VAGKVTAVMITSRLRWVALRSIRGIMRHCCSASTLLRLVLSLPALPNTYIYAANDDLSSIDMMRYTRQRRRTMIILHRFTRRRFDDAMVVRSYDGALTHQVDIGGVLGPCCLWGEGEGITSHSENDKSIQCYGDYVILF
jgi:hypothetical protein